MQSNLEDLENHMQLFDALLGPKQSRNREIRFDYDVGRDTRPDSLKPGKEFFRVQITTRNVYNNPVTVSWFYHSNQDKSYWYMTSLSLRGLGLGEIALENLKKTPLLQYLDLQGNRLDEINLNLLANMNELHTLNLSSNQIKEINIRNGTYFKNLKSISFFNNNLDEVSLDILSKAPELNRANFGQNRLTNIDLCSIQNLRYLLTLDFSENSIREISLPKNIESLNNLLLNDNEIRLLDFNGASMKSLILLQIANNQIKKLNFVELIACSPHLRRIYAWGNKIEKIIWEGTSDNYIEEINLNSNMINLMKLEGEFCNLEVLEIAYNRIKRIDLSKVRMEKIAVLNLGFNPIDEFILPDLSSMPKLKTIDLIATNLSFLVLHTKLEILLLSNEERVGQFRYKIYKIGDAQLYLPLECKIVKT